MLNLQTIFHIDRQLPSDQIYLRLRRGFFPYRRLPTLSPRALLFPGPSHGAEDQGIILRVFSLLSQHFSRDGRFFTFLRREDTPRFYHLSCRFRALRLPSRLTYLPTPRLDLPFSPRHGLVTFSSPSFQSQIHDAILVYPKTNRSPSRDFLV